MTDLPDAAGLPGAYIDPAPDPPGLLLDTPAGPHALGPPTVDSDADGHADTTVLAGPDALLLATDVDHDARVDVVTTIGADGSAETHEIPEPAEWGEGVPPPAPVIDPATGRWVRGG